MTNVEKAAEWKAKGNKELQQGNPDKAIEYFTEAINLDPENAILYSNRSAAYAQLRKWNEALSDAENTVKYKPDWPKGYSRKGLALFQLRRLESAINAYQKAVELEPSNEDLKKSLALAEDALQASESNVLGEEKLNKGKAGQAIPFFDTAIKKDPNSALYYSNRSHANYLCGRYDNAIQDADEVIRRRLDWHRGYQRRAEALSGKQQYTDAAAVYAYALKLQPDNEQLLKAFNSARQEEFLHQQREKQKKEAEKQKQTEKSSE